MTLEAAQYAEGRRRAPPPDLAAAFELRAHLGLGLVAGGLDNQPAWRWLCARVAMNVWESICRFHRDGIEALARSDPDALAIAVDAIAARDDWMGESNG